LVREKRMTATTVAVAMLDGGDSGGNGGGDCGGGRAGCGRLDRQEVRGNELHK